MLKGSAFPLERGLNKLTTGTVLIPEAILCDVDGSLTITWLDDTSSVELFVSGDTRDVKNRTKSIAVTTGTFSFARSYVK